MVGKKEEYWAYWDTCVSYLESGKVNEAVEYARQIAEKLQVSKTLINRIFAVNLSSYSSKINSYMEQCLSKARDEHAKALCLYYSLDNGWDSTIYICKDFTRKNTNWISNSKSWIDVGKARGFSGIYKKEAKSAFLVDERSTGICILLMLMTTIAFKEVVDKYKDVGLYMCITCTDSDFIQLL